MTKVQLQYDLLRPIDDHLMEQIARAHTFYGMLRIALSPTLDKLTVEYDASRLSPLEVENYLRQLGIPVVVNA
jgi:hypothetical protein